MAKNLVSWPIFVHMAQIRAARFFSKIWLRQLLDIMVSYVKKNLMIQSWENVVTDWQADRRTRVIS